MTIRHVRRIALFLALGAMTTLIEGRSDDILWTTDDGTDVRVGIHRGPGVTYIFMS